MKQKYLKYFYTPTMKSKSLILVHSPAHSPGSPQLKKVSNQKNFLYLSENHKFSSLNKEFLIFFRKNFSRMSEKKTNFSNENNF